MEGDRERDRRSSGWTGDEWPDGDWERKDRDTPERRPRIEDRGERRAGRYQSGVGIQDQLPHVEDDPLYDALPGERAPREHRHAGALRQSERFAGRRGRPALSWGQKLLLWVGFALASGVSFGAGLVVGASGGLDVPNIPFLKPQAEEVVDPTSLEALGPPPDPEGVIEFGERGMVPSRVEPPPPQPAAPKADKGSGRPAGEKAALAKGEAPKAAPETPKRNAPAPEKTAAKAPEPERRQAAAAPAETAPSAEADAVEEGAVREDAAKEDAAEMTFYETATGRRPTPGLNEVDEEAPTDTPTEQVPPDTGTDQAPAAAAAAPPVGADMLARRRAQAPESETAAPETADIPSGAALLARHQAGPGAAVQAPASTGETYTVQVSTLSDANEARALADRLGAKGFSARVVPLSRTGMVTLYRVRVGKYPTEAAARADLDRLQNEPGTHPYIRME